jgi:hypothetical protein
VPSTFIDIWAEDADLAVDIVSKMGEVAEGYRIEHKDINGLDKAKIRTSTEPNSIAIIETFFGGYIGLIITDMFSIEKKE